MVVQERFVKVVPSLVALAGFAIAVLAGLAVGNAAGVILSRALLSLVCCYAIGSAAAMIFAYAVKTHLNPTTTETAQSSKAPQNAQKSAQT